MSEVINIFIAYAREDKSYLDELRKHLKPFDRRNLIKIWYDGEIIPGTRWEDEIKQALHTAEIILLLVSANSLSSDYFYEKEVSDALSRHHKNKTIVVPIILGYCAWDMTELSNLQVLPTDGVPIDEWEPKSKGYAIIVRSLKKSIDLAREKKVGSSQKDNSEMEVNELINSEKDVGEDKMPSQIIVQEKKETLNKFAWGKGARQLFYFLLAALSKVRKIEFSKESPNFLYLISLSFLFLLILCPLTIYDMAYDEIYGLSLTLSIALGAVAFFLCN